MAMTEWLGHNWGTAVAAALTVILLLAAVARGHVESRQRAAIRAAQNRAALGTLMPDLPKPWAPFLAAGTLVALGIFFLSRTVIWARPYEHDIASQCGSGTFRIATEAYTSDSIVASLTSECNTLLANAALYVDGAEQQRTKLLLPAVAAERGTAHWFVKVNQGIQRVVLVARTTQYADAVLDVAAGADARNSVRAGDDCTMTAGVRAPQSGKRYAAEVTFSGNSCSAVVGSEKLLVDGAPDGATFLGTFAAPSSGEKTTVVDRWIVLSTEKPPRIDVVLADKVPMRPAAGVPTAPQGAAGPTSAPSALEVDLKGKARASLTESQSFINTIFGVLATVGGLIGGVFAAQPRPTSP
jgi:hypothetical protein